jgi:hypothetical protein
MPHVSQLLQAFLHESHSARGATLSKKASTSKDSSTSRYSIVEENQYHYRGEVEAELLPTDVAEEIVRKLADYDDLRWAFFRELR